MTNSVFDSVLSSSVGAADGSKKVADATSRIEKRTDIGLRTAFRRLAAILAVLGPGQMVMMADTEVGSVITAAQSGAR